MKIQIHLAHKIEKAVMYDYMATQQHKTKLTWNILGVVAEEKLSDLKSCCSGSYLLQ